MAKQNNVYLYGVIEKLPRIIKDPETDSPTQGISYIHTVRSVRNAHDGRRYVKHDHPLIIAQTEKTINEMATWNENDLAYIKGSLFSKRIEKKTYCPECKGENYVKGLLSYVAPIFVKKISEKTDLNEAVNNIIKNREVSNQAIIIGNLLNEPSCYQLESGLIVTQYQIITNRKVHVKADEPDVKADVLWVKSYGSHAIEDRRRLTRGSVVISDGYLQARQVRHKTKCQHCGYIYPWIDQAMEIVPFDTEYVQGTFKTDEMLEAEGNGTIEELKANIKEKVEGDKNRFNKHEDILDIEENL